MAQKKLSKDEQLKMLALSQAFGEANAGMSKSIEKKKAKKPAEKKKAGKK